MAPSLIIIVNSKSNGEVVRYNEAQKKFKQIDKYVSFLKKEICECSTSAEKDAINDMIFEATIERTRYIRKLEEDKNKRVARKRRRKSFMEHKGKYSQAIKLEAIRVLASATAPSQAQLARSLGIPHGRISKWWRKAVEDGIVVDSLGNLIPANEAPRERFNTEIMKELPMSSLIALDEDERSGNNVVILTDEELTLLWCRQEAALSKEYVEKADNILTGKVLKKLYEKHGGHEAARLAAREKGWLK